MWVCVQLNRTFRVSLVQFNFVFEQLIIFSKGRRNKKKNGKKRNEKKLLDSRPYTESFVLSDQKLLE